MGWVFLKTNEGGVNASVMKRDMGVGGLKNSMTYFMDSLITLVPTFLFELYIKYSCVACAIRNSVHNP